jgi:serine/threonine-protein kinase
LLEELKALQRSLPTSSSWEKGGTNSEAAPAAPPPPPPPRSPGVIEWAHLAGLFSRMVSRAYTTGKMPAEVQGALSAVWDLASKANSLEGDVASHTRKLEALERRGRALRAEIGRKVEELAQEESRSLREAAAFAAECESAQRELAQAERVAREQIAVADRAEQSGQGSRQVFEKAGAARAMVDARSAWLNTRETRRRDRESVASDLRRQIDELRAQLGRYAEALEEDLSSGREKVAARSKEGLVYERRFQEASNVLINHLKGRPECRDLMNEMTNSSGRDNSDQHTSSPRTSN